MEHEAIDAPEEGGEGFAGSCGSKDEGTFATGDDGPAHALGGGGCIKHGAKPLRRHGVEAGERIGARFRSRVGMGRERGHAS